MFDRAACANDSVVVATPHVDSSALSVLAGLLADVLKGRAASSNALLSGASVASRDQNRGEAHVRQDNGVPAERARQNPKYPAGSHPDQQNLFSSTT